MTQLILASFGADSCLSHETFKQINGCLRVEANFVICGHCLSKECTQKCYKYTFETRDLSVIQILSSAVGASFGPKIEISSPTLMRLLSNLSRL